MEEPVSAELVLVPRKESDVGGGAVADRGRRFAAIASPALVQWIALSGLFAFTLEMTCRIEDWIRFRTPLLSPITSQEDLLVRDRDGVHGRPNARFRKWVMNAIGTRGPRASLEKPPRTVRIVTIGASEVFGLSESPGKDFPRQLEDTLNARLATRCRTARPLRVEVLNAALPGMSLPTVEQDVRNRVRRFGADFILLYPTPANYLNDDPPFAARPDTSGRPPGLPTVRILYPRFVDRVRDQAKASLPELVKTWLRRRQTEAYIRTKPPGWRFTSIPSDRLGQYDRDLRTLISTIRSAGAVPIVATHANAFMRPGFADENLLSAWERFYPRAPGSVIVAFDSAARDVTLDAASDSGAPVVDIARRVSASSGVVFSDFSHFTDHGAALVAGTLAPKLLSAGKSHDVCGGG
jgi:hypothetical protein